MNYSLMKYNSVSIEWMIKLKKKKKKTGNLHFFIQGFQQPL